MDIKKSSVEMGSEYMPDNYRESGIYLNDFGDGQEPNFIYVNKETHLAMLLDGYNMAKHIFEEPSKETKKGDVSEEFALKMLSIATGNDKYKEL